MLKWIQFNNCQIEWTQLLSQDPNIKNLKIISWNQNLKELKTLIMNNLKIYFQMSTIIPKLIKIKISKSELITKTKSKINIWVMMITRNCLKVKSEKHLTNWQRSKLNCNNNLKKQKKRKGIHLNQNKIGECKIPKIKSKDP